MKRFAKNIMSYLLVVTMIITLSFSTFADSVHTLGGSNNDVVSANVLAQIDELYNHRGLLAIDFEKNQEAIEEIDKRILELGAVEVTPEYVADKYANAVSLNNLENGVSPAEEIPVESNLVWTSTRTKITYRGTLYELQIINASPSSMDGPLNGSVAAVQRTQEAAVEVAATEMLTIAAETVIGLVPIFGTAYSVAVSLYDILHLVDSNLGEYEKVSNVNATYTSFYSTNQKMIYVKQDGQLDSEQILCYMGNKTYYNTTITVGAKKQVDNGGWYTYGTTYSIPSDTSIQSEDCSVASPYYSNPTAIACNNYYNKVFNSQSINANYCVDKITESHINGGRSVTINVVLP